MPLLLVVAIGLLEVAFPAQSSFSSTSFSLIPYSLPALLLPFFMASLTTIARAPSASPSSDHAHMAVLRDPAHMGVAIFRVIYTTENQ